MKLVDDDLNNLPQYNLIVEHIPDDVDVPCEFGVMDGEAEPHKANAVMVMVKRLEHTGTIITCNNHIHRANALMKMMPTIRPAA